MRKEKDLSFNEKVLYEGEKDLIIENSFFKTYNNEKQFLSKCSNIALINTTLDINYPLWENTGLLLDNVNISEYSNDVIWNSKNIEVKNSNIAGTKAFALCNNIEVIDSIINSNEAFRKTNNVKIDNTKMICTNAFDECTNLSFNRVNFAGISSFQGTKNIEIKDSVIKTKNAFANACDLTITDSLFEGENLGWNSKNVTLIRCHLKGARPFCNAINVKLIDCTTSDVSEAFENADISGNIKGSIISIKNLKSGVLKIDSVGEIINTNDSYKPTIIQNN